jgi:predicted nucleic acid-binding protein
MIVVSDTSAISSLLVVGQLDLLSVLFGVVTIPVAVHSELLVVFPELPAWIRVEGVSDLTAVTNFRMELDAGEAEAIQLAKELRADRLLIDDRKGRSIAEEQGIKVIGLLGVILLAKSQGLIPLARPVVRRLQIEAEFFLSDEVMENALKSIGE